MVGLFQSIRGYLHDQFPLVSQGGAVLSAYILSYLLYGEINGQQEFQWLALAGGVSLVLLFLQRRIVDDIEDLKDDLARRGLSLETRGRHRLHGLLIGAVVVSSVVVLLNAFHGSMVLLASVAICAWTPVATLMKHSTKNRLVRFVLHETCPAVILAYVYFVWLDVAGKPLPTLGVVATISLFWTVYLFWNFTRKIGSEEWPPWDIQPENMKWVLLALLSVSLASTVGIAIYANMPAVYIPYGVAVPVGFGALIIHWWSNVLGAPGRTNGTGASWKGLRFAVAVELGVMFGLVASAIHG